MPRARPRLVPRGVAADGDDGPAGHRGLVRPSSSSTSCCRAATATGCGPAARATDSVLMLTAKDGDQTRPSADTGADDYPQAAPDVSRRSPGRCCGARRRPRARPSGGRPAHRPGGPPVGRRPAAHADRPGKVLEFLARRRHAVQGRHPRRGDFDFDGDPNIVEVYVRRRGARSTSPSASRRSAAPLPAGRPVNGLTRARPAVPVTLSHCGRRRGLWCSGIGLCRPATLAPEPEESLSQGPRPSPTPRPARCPVLDPAGDDDTVAQVVVGRPARAWRRPQTSRGAPACASPPPAPVLRHDRVGARR
jgi:hypothetical protein